MFNKLIKFIFLFISIPQITIAAGPTLVAGNISGIWTLDESPYVLTDNSTVQNGKVLTIEPGVTVIIGENLQLSVYGQIVASGTHDNRIIFTSPNETLKWNKIYIYGYDVNDSPSNKIEYCDFLNAQTALSRILFKFRGKTE